MPGHETTSTMRAGVRRCRARCRPAPRGRAGSAASATHGSTRFWSLVVRSVPLPCDRASARHGAHLLARDVAERQLHDDGAVARLALRPRVGAPPVLEARARRGARPRGGAAGRRHAIRRRRCSRTSARSSSPRSASTRCDLGLDRARNLSRPILLDDVLHARPVAVLALAVAVLDAHDRLAPDEEVVGGDEVARSASRGTAARRVRRRPTPRSRARRRAPWRRGRCRSRAPARSRAGQPSTAILNFRGSVRLSGLKRK